MNTDLLKNIRSVHDDWNDEKISPETAMTFIGMYFAEESAIQPPQDEPEQNYAECWVCGRSMDGTSEDDCHCFHRKELAAPSVALSTLTDSVWAKIEVYADAVYEFNTALRIDVGIDKASAKCLAIEKELRALLAASAPAQQAGPSPEILVEQYIADLISRSPDPLRELGDYLGRVLDEDEWPTAERFVLAAMKASLATPPQPVAAEVAEKNLRAIIAHWNEFGPRHGFGELMDRIQDAEQGGES